MTVTACTISRMTRSFSLMSSMPSGGPYEKEHPDLFEAEIAKSKSEDTAILVYTSGTTGPPKGAMISHSNIMFSLASGLTSVPTFDTDELVCFLPLCHILERLFSGFRPDRIARNGQFCRKPGDGF